ncbi:MAG: T9SS type A sorting domain-containing protein [Bacteroidetes bacterium]|nr:T9SS type A sorting domain-containing protein [Bacteroidota bacterium]
MKASILRNKRSNILLYFVFTLFPIFLFSKHSYGQQYINAYAKVTNINYGSEFLRVSSVSGQYDYSQHSFAIGDKVLIWQIQDSVIGNNTSDTSTFGDLSSIRNAGKFEVSVITNITYNSGLPRRIYLDTIKNTYNLGNKSSIQVISVRHFGNYTTTSDLTALAWNGSIGGALVMVVDSTLTLQHNINVDAKGFRGGAPGWDDNSGSCGASEESNYIANDGKLGAKGEGIYKNTDSNFMNRRGKILTGGGGGNYHNAGGGGGGNFSAGGLGGNGWGGGPSNNGLCTYICGGLGGIALEGHIAPDRLFLGGGGGGGQGNQTPNNATKGGNGGGAIFIQANTIETTGNCAGLSISANGESANPTSGNDGGGGGGAAGTIIFNVNNWNVVSGCVLSITANGGNGSSVVHSDAHGGGGAGAQGVIAFSTQNVPTNNITTTTLNGAPGLNCNGCTNNHAGNASNVDNKGIFTFWHTPLPVELAYFRATKINEETAYIDWATSMEINASYFTILKSFDGINWIELSVINANGNSNEYKTYGVYDSELKPGKNMYKLMQTDIDGVTVEKSIATVFVPFEDDFFVISPNPNDGVFTIELSDIVVGAQVEVLNMLGQIIYSDIFNTYSKNIQLPENKGVYIVKVKIGEKIIQKRIICQ